MKCIVQNFVLAPEAFAIGYKMFVHAPKALTVGYKMFVHAPEAFTVGYKMLTFFKFSNLREKYLQKRQISPRQVCTKQGQPEK